MEYLSAKKPYAQQKEALSLFAGRPKYALLMDMRTGKTKVILDDFGQLELNGDVKNLFVIAPGGAYETWVEAIREHVSEDLKERVQVYLWQSSKNSRREKQDRHYFLTETRPPRILIMNVEALSSIKEARELSIAFTKSASTMLVIDESTIIKNKSKRTKFITDDLATHAPYRRIMTGLVAPRSPLDLYYQYYFLDWRILGFKSFFAFRARYAIIYHMEYGGRMVPIIKGFRNTEELAKKIAPYSYRKLLKDCYDMPESVYTQRAVTLSKEQERLVKEIKAYATAAINETDHVTATIVISQILRIHQILCGFVTDEGGGIHSVDEHRTEQLLALLDDYSGKAIIWCSYDYNIRKVSEALLSEYGPGSIARFWGGNRGEREAEEARFKYEPNCRFMVATAAAGGRGREWSVADLVVYYSNSHDLEHRSQSEERAKAVGKKQFVTYCDLVAKRTIDEKIIQTLRNKITLSSALTGDAYREWLI